MVFAVVKQVLTSMIPLHAQFDCLLYIPKIMQVTKKDVNGTDTKTELERMDLYLGEANSMTHIGAMDPLTMVANPMMKRPTIS